MKPERHAPLVVGVVHLPPLPGAPRATLPLDAIVAAAVRDAVAYRDGGASAVIVENFGDAPFLKGPVEPHTVAAMALAVREVAAAVPLPIGVNVLRNDAPAAIGIAAMTGASFVRVNVHTGAMVTDQGVLEGRADLSLRYRRQLGAPVEIWADLMVKHGVPLGDQSLEDVARDAVERGLADAVIVTGAATGRPALPDDVRRVRLVLPDTPIYIGSGVSAANATAFLPAATGFIVGTWAKVDGRIENPVDPNRVRRLVDAVGG
ncbi:MAG TPA: BtpA/SgcQ family protein [Thermomicrobiaceae bacterium]|nr:BtpA/SgcQ family protein [Thermomicrobiaceae bacterium]